MRFRRISATCKRVGNIIDGVVAAGEFTADGKLVDYSVNGNGVGCGLPGSPSRPDHLQVSKMTSYRRQVQTMEVEPMQFISVSNSGLDITRRGIFALLVIGLLMISVITPAHAAPPGQSPEEGQAIFQGSCAPCHTIGGGPLVGPDLEGVTAARDRDWLVRWISQPDKMLAERDPIAIELLAEFNNVPMPDMGLSEAEAAAVLAYLETQSGEAPGEQPVEATAPSQPQPALAPPVGDPAIGQALFIGVTPLHNGGPPCLSCHSVAGAGALGGGVLGPDLTQVFNRYGGEAGLASVLSTSPFPTMQPIFSGRPLTPEEQAHLGAFLRAASSHQPAQATWQLGALTVAGFIGLIALAQVVWRRRLRGVRRPLLEQT